MGVFEMHNVTNAHTSAKNVLCLLLLWVVSCSLTSLLDQVPLLLLLPVPLLQVTALLQMLAVPPPHPPA